LGSNGVSIPKAKWSLPEWLPLRINPRSNASNNPGQERAPWSLALDSSPETHETPEFPGHLVEQKLASVSGLQIFKLKINL
jgi:hypothetical protein